MDKSAFFAALRKRESGLFGTSLSQRQVDGIDAVLDAGAVLSLQHLANVLAQVYHETGGGMYPVKETVYPYSKDKDPSNAQVIARLDRAFAKGQLPRVKSPYWRDGAFGRGQIQITHWDNYRKLSPHVGVDLVANPDLALEPAISARIAVEGCRLGLFTGKRLSNFDGAPYDHYNARSIVNGDKNKTVKEFGKMGDKITAHAKAFEAALEAGRYGSEIEQSAPDPVKTPSEPVANTDGLLTRLIDAIFAAIFGPRK